MENRDKATYKHDPPCYADDFHEGRILWDKAQNGDSLLLRLFQLGVPLMARDTPGIQIGQIRYSKDGAQRVRWLSKKTIKKVRKELKKNGTVWKCCVWTIIPIRIVPIKQSTRPEDQNYVHLLQTVQYSSDEERCACQNSINQTDLRGWVNLVKIETRSDGSIIRRITYPDAPKDKLPYKFSFPKRFFKKINRCLSGNYWYDLWKGPDCFSWFVTAERRPWYMFGRHLQIDESYQEQLERLLKTPQSDAAAIILSYICFSVLRPFFHQFHVVRADMPYQTVKKYLPEQFALNFVSSDLKSADALVSMFCSPFQSAAWPKTTDAGIQLQINHNKQKMTSLTQRKFEAKITQPAAVVWTNHKPDAELVKTGKLLP